MKKILVAYDGDEPAHRALERGAELAQAFGAELGVVSVTPWRRGRFPTDVWDDAEAHARALKSAERLAEPARPISHLAVTRRRHRQDDREGR